MLNGDLFVLPLWSLSAFSFSLVSFALISFVLSSFIVPASSFPFYMFPSFSFPHSSNLFLLISTYWPTHLLLSALFSSFDSSAPPVSSFLCYWHFLLLPSQSFLPHDLKTHQHHPSIKTFRVTQYRPWMTILHCSHSNSIKVWARLKMNVCKKCNSNNLAQFDCLSPECGLRDK